LPDVRTTDAFAPPISDPISVKVAIGEHTILVVFIVVFLFCCLTHASMAWEKVTNCWELAFCKGVVARG
jgi:hypothetical protein